MNINFAFQSTFIKYKYNEKLFRIKIEKKN